MQPQLPTTKIAALAGGLLVLLFGVGIFGLFHSALYPVSPTGQASIQQALSPVVPDLKPVPPMELGPEFLEAKKQELIASGTAFMEADLTGMKLRIWENGAVIKEVDILTKGRPGSWWETPAGVYSIKAKEPNHFSGFGHVYQPWSMVFQGNFFIHGWPYYPDGTPVASAYSGGCIRLSTEDAKLVYQMTKVGMPVIVSEESFTSDKFSYPVVGMEASTSARAYLVADLKSRSVLAASNQGESLPIASITKLMTALVAAEYINLDKPIAIRQSAIVPTTIPRLKAGESHSAYQLLYPLLAESSNEAAFALSDHLGRNYFVALMNQKAAALGMKTAHFEDPAGIGPGNTASTEDLFALAQHLLYNRSFILRITSGTLGANAYGPTEFKDLKNFNLFSGKEDFVGGKVGQTPEAGKTMLAIFNEKVAEETRPILVVVLHSGNNGADVAVLKDAMIHAYGNR